MLGHIFRREILEHFISLRFSLTFILVIVVMSTIGFVFIGEHTEMSADFSRNRNEYLDKLRQTTKKPEPLGGVTFPQSVYKSPNPLQFLAEGHEQDLPNTCEVGAFYTEGPYLKSRGNFMLGRSNPFDWAFVMGTIFSFVAIILTYDAISGEREKGTLRLTLSNAVSRGTLLLGKYLAVMVSISMPLFVGITMNLFIIITSGALSFDAGDWAKICAMIGVSLVYISAFVLLSLFISSSFRESSTALVVLLLLWVMSVVIVPSSGGIIASKLKKPASLEQWRGRLQAKLASAPRIRSTYWSPGEPLTPAISFANAREGVLDEYRGALVNQIQWTRNFTSISPTANYQYAAEAIAGTGLTRYETFWKQVKQYKMELLEFTKTEYAKNQRNPDIRYAVDYDAIPKFTDKLPSLSSTAQSALLNLMLLCLFNIAFFVAAFVSFLRYDVR